jgi:hypothetical protein
MARIANGSRFCGRVVHGGNCPRSTVVRVGYPWGELSTGRIVQGALSLDRVVHETGIHGASVRGRDVCRLYRPRSTFPRTSCPRVKPPLGVIIHGRVVRRENCPKNIVLRSSCTWDEMFM